MSDIEWITTAEAAELAGVKPPSWRGMVNRSADLQAGRRMRDGRTPVYDRAVVEEYVRTRPGRGRHGPHSVG